ncbi:MAG: 50S ribosomal protein L4 [Thermoprotei archaeon]
MPEKLLVSKEIVERRVPVYDASGNVVSDVVLPRVFSFPVRKDLIRRAFLASFTARLQPKGRDPLAGKRRVGESWGIGHSVARVPRLDNGRAVLAPMTRGGRLAHPPRVEKVIRERINQREKIRAIASAIAATGNPELVKLRGHLFEKEVLPIVVDDQALNIAKTSEARNLLKNLGVLVDVERAREGVRVRAGKGKMRGRRYVKPRSLLIVVHEERLDAYKAFRNLPGVDVIPASMLSVIHLAPGGVPGRLTIYTKTALEILEKKFEVRSL